MRPEDSGIGKLFEEIRDAVTGADAKTQRISPWNGAATSVFGYLTSEAVELCAEELVPEYLEAAYWSDLAYYSEMRRGSYTYSHRELKCPL